MNGKARSIVVRDTGGPERLELVDAPTPIPGVGQALIEVEAAGVNFIDVYFREGIYPYSLPFTVGVEGAGRIVAFGDDATGEFEVGDRVAWCMVPNGSYSTHAVVDVSRLIEVPEGIEARNAAAVLLQGITAQFLSDTTFPASEGDVALVHAGAGGVGQLLIQFLARKGVTVISTVSTERKAEIARKVGAEHVINYRTDDFVEATRTILGSRGVDVVYDGVGESTFLGGLELLRPRGMMVLYGASSGPVQPIDPQVLNAKGSLYLTRPSIAHYIEDPDEYRSRAAAVFDEMLSGTLHVAIGVEFPLSEAADAHRMLESRRSEGKMLIVPST